MPRTFTDDRTLLLDVFRDVVARACGEDAFALHERTVELARAARGGDDSAVGTLADLVGGLDVGRAEVLVRTLTRWFQLINLAEDNDRIRRLRDREARQAPEPRRGSLRDAIERLRAEGVGDGRLERLLGQAEVRLVLTAHPTEARRRTTIEKLARVFRVLRDLDERPGVSTDDDARRRLAPTIQELWASDELRAVSPTVLDEVRANLVWFVTTLAAEVPEVYRDLEEAVGPEVAVPSLLSFGSWIGGDRDGNPNVTPDVTLEALDLMREQCLRFVELRVELLAGRVSISERVSGPAHGLDRLLAEGEEHFPALAQRLAELNPEEPYRRAFTFLRERVRATRRGEPGGYAEPAELLADLRQADASLREGSGALTAAGDLHDVLRQVEVFGFHFARLDIREHAGRHRAALDEILSRLQVRDGYADTGDDERLDLLSELIADRRPLIPEDISGFSEDTRTVVQTFRAVRDALAGRHRGALRSYVVSGTEGPADLLEVLLLMKEAGLSKPGGEDAVLRIVPLFEAAETLRDAAATMDACLRRDVYRTALRAVGDEQEVMIGYSDSNKDAGYVASGWSTYQAQIRVADVLRSHGASWLFFHGRGGSLGRGGGPSNTAILALPAGTVEGRLKVTEQGEVLAAKYMVAEVAHRELELTTSATLVAAVQQPPGDGDERAARHERVMARMADRSEEVYRDLVHGDPDFVAFFTAVTPIDEISRLRLGSRPAKRRADGGIEALRAIPWVFSWTQSRIVLPAWYGLGTALEEARAEAGLDVLRTMEREWPFFAGLISNAEMALAKADLAIARRYVDLWDDEAPRERIWGRIVEEFERTERELLLVADEDRLLDRVPVLQASIDRRNPFVDPLSFLQVELLRRLKRNGDAAEDDALGRVSLLTINGIAGGLRNTG
ncbi:MAG: phosphoenolpyruvate carboxylase [Solirubrobacteraceae bacterium]|nr:phosphoenolpyruvate carboxylase [Solirubrobacteraceae bacterium]